jgi:hypothetical protein
VTGEVDAATDQDAETVQRVARVPASWEIACTAIGSATANVIAEPLSTQVRTVGDVPDVLHETSLLRKPTFLPGSLRLGKQHPGRLLVDAHCLIRRLSDCRHSDAPVLSE